MARNDNLLGLSHAAMTVSKRARDLQLSLNTLLDDRRLGVESDVETYKRLARSGNPELLGLEAERDRLLPEINANLAKEMVMQNQGTAAEQLAALGEVGSNISKNAVEKRAIVDGIIEKRLVEIQAEKGVNSRSEAWALASTDRVVQDAYQLSNQLGEEGAAALRAAGL